MKPLGVFCVTAAFLSTLAERPIVNLAAARRQSYPRSCLDVPYRESGVYSIEPEWPFRNSILVYCDQEYESGGWAVIQRRIDGTVDFERYEADYIEGFGNIQGEFWLGLENIYRLVKSERHELVILLEDFSGNVSLARYEPFSLKKYTPKLFAISNWELYSGSAGDFLKGLNEDLQFRSLDGFNPEYSNFWIPTARSNLYGKYMQPNKPGTNPEEGLYWGNIKAGSIKSTKMMVRPTRPTEVP